MICYNNIYSLCLSCNDNPFNYIQTSINNENIILAVEKSTQDIFDLSQIIPDCDLFNESQTIDLHTCYRLYLQNCSESGIFAPVTSIQINETINTINDTFNNISNNGILTTGNNNLNLILPSSEENLIHLGNIAILSSLMYEQNSTGSIPPILDIHNNIYLLDYQSLSDLALQYFAQTINSYYVQSNLQKTLSNTDNSTIINTCEYCDQKNPKSFDTPTTLIPDFTVEICPEVDPYIPNEPTRYRCVTRIIDGNTTYRCEPIILSDIPLSSLSGVDPVFPSFSACASRCGQYTCSNLPSGCSCEQLVSFYGYNAGAPITDQTAMNTWREQFKSLSIAMINGGYSNVRVAEEANVFNNGYNKYALGVYGECCGSLASGLYTDPVFAWLGFDAGGAAITGLAVFPICYQ